VNTIRFGTDGWRGVIADDFTFENVRMVAFAVARYIARAEKPGHGVIVGYDNRFGSEKQSLRQACRCGSRRRLALPRRFHY